MSILKYAVNEPLKVHRLLPKRGLPKKHLPNGHLPNGHLPKTNTKWTFTKWTFTKKPHIPENGLLPNGHNTESDFRLARGAVVIILRFF